MVEHPLENVVTVLSPMLYNAIVYPFLVNLCNILVPVFEEKYLLNNWSKIERGIKFVKAVFQIVVLMFIFVLKNP